MSRRSPSNVIVVNTEREPFAAYESHPIGPGYRSLDGPYEWLSERVFTCLYREGRRGIVREPEGIETPRSKMELSALTK